MAFVSNKSKPKSGKSNLPDHQLVVKVSTSKGYVTLGKIGLYNESSLHSKIAQLTNEQLIKLLAKAEVSVVPYNNGNNDDDFELNI